MKKLLLSAPLIVKSFILNLLGFFQNLKRYTRLFEKQLSYYQEIDSSETYGLNKQKIMELQASNSYWSKFEFEQIPIINKQYALDHWQEIYNSKEKSGTLKTSGTTGQGLIYPVSKEFLANQWAVFWKFRMIHGLTRNSWCAYIIGKPLFQISRRKAPYWIRSYSTRQLLFSQFHISPNTVKEYLNRIKEDKKIQWLHAYPSTLNYFAEVIDEVGLSEFAKTIGLSIITTSSERLLNYQKEKIQMIFGCPMRQLYGLTEGVANIFECNHGSLHIDESYSFVECIPTNTHKEYRIIGTCYHNKSFPLLKYDTGDLVLINDTQRTCICGRKSRIVDEILGREEDFLVLKDGRKIGRLDHIFKGIQTVKEAQICQLVKGEAVFRIVKSKEYSNRDQKRIELSIKEKLGADFAFSIDYTEEIPRTSTGKLKFVISKVL